MTCLEKLKMEHPEYLDSSEPSGALTCPHFVGYADPPPIRKCTANYCAECWQREAFDDFIQPAEKKEEPHAKLGIPLDDISDSHIKDSGDRTLFDTGAVRDMREGKGRCDLMPLEVVGALMKNMIFDALAMFQETGDTDHLYECIRMFAKTWDDGKPKSSGSAIISQRHCSMLLDVAKHFEEGAKKYGENNWQKGIPVHCYIDSAVRHYLKWLRGDKDEPHDRAFVWNLMCCIWEVDYHRPKEDTGDHD